MRKTSFLVAGLAILGLGASVSSVAGCDKSSRPGGSAQSQAPSGLPAAGAAGAGADAMPANPHAGLDMAGADPHAGLNMGDNPHGGGMQGNLPTPGPLDPASLIEGTIEVAPALAAKIKPGDVIFLSLKAVDPTSGEIRRGPLAVDRIEIQKLPQAFVLSNQNQMTPGTKIEGQVAVTARVDRDADAMTRTAGDLEGIVKTTPPQKALKVVIDTEVQ